MNPNDMYSCDMCGSSEGAPPRTEIPTKDPKAVITAPEPGLPGVKTQRVLRIVQVQL